MSVRLREQIVEIIVNSAMAKALGDKWIKKHKGNLFGMNVWNSAIDKLADQILALIGKCATPTFSGEKETCVRCVNTACVASRVKENKRCEYFNNKPTEQKECLHEEDTYQRGEGVTIGTGICKHCNKPIPAEKKECEHEASYHLVCMHCGKLVDDKYEIKPEPKPKERIEPLTLPSQFSLGFVIEKINELAEEYGKLIHFINNIA